MVSESPANKRPPSNSADAAQQHMANALAPVIQPPAHVKLSPEAITFWNDVVCARARDLWTEADLLMAANLARALCDIERLQAEITAEGDILENKRGTPVINPRHLLIESLSRRSISIMGKLQIHAAATGGRKADAQAALDAERAARAAAGLAKTDEADPEMVHDDLIPTTINLH